MQESSARPPHRIFTIRRREGDKRYVLNSGRVEICPFGTSLTLELAIANACDIALKAVATDGSRIMIMAQNDRGFLERAALVEP